MANEGRVYGIEPAGFMIGARVETVGIEATLREQDSLPRKDYSLDGILNILRNTTDASLPNSLIADLGFDALDWQLVVQHHGMSGLFVGGPKNHHQTISVHEALGIIELRTVAEGKNPHDIFENRTISPRQIKISGNSLDTNGDIRAIALKYTLSPLNRFRRITAALVSVSEAELPHIDDDLPDHDVHDDAKNVRTEFDGRLTNQIENAGFITKAMLNQTKGHNQALKIPGNHSGELYMPTNWSIGDYRNPGFQLVFEPDGLKLCFDEKNRGRSRFTYDHSLVTYAVPSWKITIPHRLQTEAQS